MLDGILFYIFFRFNIMVLKLWLPQPYHGYVKTFQWWLMTAQQCATEGYLIFPPPPPPEPDSRRLWLYKTLIFFYIWPILLSLVDRTFTVILWNMLRIVFKLETAFLGFIAENRLLSLSARYRKMLLCLALFGASNPTHAKLTMSRPSRNTMSPSTSIDPNTKPFVPNTGYASGATSGGADSNVNQLAAALIQALSAMNNQQPASASAAAIPSPPPPETGVTLNSGVGFRSSGPRTNKELEDTRILVTRAQRQALQAKPEALKKLRDRVCVALPHTIQEIKWHDILDTSTDSDLGSAMIGVKTMMEDIKEFAAQYDLSYVCEILLVRDLFNESELAMCIEFKNLLSDYMLFDEGYVRQYQEVVNVRGFAVDVESISRWLQAVLEKSIEPTLLIRVKQRLATFSIKEVGGLSMFFVVANMVAKPSHEFIETGQSWIKQFKLSNFPGENVPIANSRFKAVVEALGAAPGGLPPTTIDKYLEGMNNCACEKFRILVSSLIGSYNNPMDRIKERFTVASILDQFSTALDEKYAALVIDKEWSGVSSKGSIFLADKRRDFNDNRRNFNDNRRDGYRRDGTDKRRDEDDRRYGDRQQRKHRYPTREAWFDAQICGKCGKNHPTFAHDDPVGKRSLPRKPPNKGYSKSKLAKRVREAVHNLIAESQLTQDELEEQHYANMAGSDHFEALGEEDGDESGDNEDDGEVTEEEDGAISALVAAALGNLLKD